MKHLSTLKARIRKQAKVRNAECMRISLSILEHLATVFPGLIDWNTDNETEVNGSDLVDALTQAVAANPELIKHLRHIAKGE